MNATKKAGLLQNTENTPLQRERSPLLRSGQKNPLMTTQRRQSDGNFYSMQHQSAFFVI